MAIKKDHECETGVIGNYWKITMFTHCETVESMRLSLYKDEGARRDNKKPLLVQDFNFDLVTTSDLYPVSPFKIEEMDKEGNNFKKIGYEWLKEQDQFLDCIDVLETVTVEVEK